MGEQGDTIILALHAASRTKPITELDFFNLVCELVPEGTKLLFSLSKRDNGWVYVKLDVEVANMLLAYFKGEGHTRVELKAKVLGKLFISQEGTKRTLDARPTGR